MENTVNTKFEVNPLDVNIAKMQFNLIKKCGNDIPEKGNFSAIEEHFTSLDSTIDLSDIKIICEPSKNEDERILYTAINRKNPERQIREELFRGSKKELIEYLEKTDIFVTCKTLCLK